jgi:hypothetical protein
MAITQVIGTIGKIGGVIGKLFGSAPRGEYQKFLRVVYPGMVEQARSRDLPVRIFWFDQEIIEVRPDGSYGVIARQIASIQDMERYYSEASKTQRFLSVSCGADAPNSPEEFAANCSLTQWGPRESPPLIDSDKNGQVTQAGIIPGNLTGLLIVGAIVAIVVVAVALFKK